MAKTRIFIDSRVNDQELLISQFIPGTEYQVLDASRDGIEQIVSALSGQSGYDSIQIISHGSSGSITIGSTVLDSSTMGLYASELSIIGNALTESGDLLLYGCNVAVGDEGHHFIETLSQMTGADVAASDDPTGGTAAGGDWVLEVRTGVVDQTSEVSVDAYNSILTVNSAPVIFQPYAQLFAARVDYSTGSFPSSVTSADVNGDGMADLIVANLNSNSVSVLQNNGDGTFAAKVDYATGSSPFSVTSADVNGDGKVDLIVANYSSNNVSVLLNNGDGTFSAKVDYPSGASLLSSTPISISSSDFNNDGYTDLVVANLVGASVSVLMNDKSGGFSSKIDYTTGSYPYSVTSADVNGDGKADVITANYGDSTVSVLLNTGDGTLAGKVDFITKNGANSVTTADVNGDGKIDVITANYDSSSVSVLLNTTVGGTLGFASHVDYDTGSGAASVSVADFNGDGKGDLVVANSIGSTLSVLLNNGDGTFAYKIDYSSGANPYAAIGADLNGDGRPDIISANYGDSSVSVFLNNMTNNNAPVLTVANATVNLAENALSGEVSGADANATDADTNNAVTFSLLSPPLNSSSEPLFSIDYLTGQVSLTAAGQTAIDYESSTKSYILTVKASDGLAAHDQTATITVNLTNINDNAPFFTSGGTGSVNENAATSSVIYTVTSTDADGALPAAIYTLGGTDAGLLNLNSVTGEVTLKSSADYEAKTSYSFDVVANDGLNNTTQAVVISVNNLNDNDPVLSVENAIVNMAENAATGMVSGVVAHATDADGDTIVYTLLSPPVTGSSQPLFSIDSLTGQVDLTPAGHAAIDYESSTRSYTLTVNASDGLPAHDQTQTITLNLTNVNDNAPFFTSGDTGTVDGRAAASTVIYTATTTDADNLAPATYTLGGTDASLLDIDATTGVVRLKDAANYLLHPSYNFDVLANDGANTTTHSVALTVINGYDLTGHVTFWKTGAAIAGVTSSLDSAPAASGSQLVEFRNIVLNPDGSLSLEIWETSAKTDINDLQLELLLPAGSASSWQDATGLPSDWISESNTMISGEFFLAGIGFTALSAGPVKLGTLTLSAPANPQHFEISLSFGQLGGDTVSGFTIVSDSMTTALDGLYQHLEMTQGAYTLTSAKVTGTAESNAVMSNDALAALKMAVEINPNADGSAVSPYQYLAADVNKDGQIKATDALNILQMAVKLETAPANEWLFVPESVGSESMSRTHIVWPVNPIPVTLENNQELNLIGIVKGDVNGSWTA